MMLLKSQVKAMFEEEIRQAGVAYAHAMEIRSQEIEERRRILLASLQNMTSDNEKIVIEERKKIAEDSSKAKSALEDLKNQREQVMQKLDDVIKEAQEEFQSLKASLHEQQQQWKETTDLIIQSIARGLANAKVVFILFCFYFIYLFFRRRREAKMEEKRKLTINQNALY